MLSFILLYLKLLCHCNGGKPQLIRYLIRDCCKGVASGELLTVSRGGDFLYIVRLIISCFCNVVKRAAEDKC